MQRQALKELLSDWHEWLPLAGIAVLAIVGIVLWLRRKPEDASDIERQRRAYLNRVGRIVEGQVLEVVDHQPVETRNSRRESIRDVSRSARPSPSSNGTQKLLYYTYSISGVTYETAQDITGLEEAVAPESRGRRSNRQREIRSLESQQFHPPRRRLVRAALNDQTAMLIMRPHAKSIHAAKLALMKNTACTSKHSNTSNKSVEGDTLSSFAEDQFASTSRSASSRCLHCCRNCTQVSAQQKHSPQNSAISCAARPSATIDPGLYSALRWRLIGPYRAGRVSAVAGIPGDPTTYYMGTPGGGVWKTTSGGTVWKPDLRR